MPCMSCQDGRVIVGVLTKALSTGEGIVKPLQYSSLKSPISFQYERPKDMTLKDELPRLVGAQPNMLLEEKGEITPERLNIRDIKMEGNTQVLFESLLELHNYAFEYGLVIQSCKFSIILGVPMTLWLKIESIIT